jgi:hypothetical protein
MIVTTAKKHGTLCVATLFMQVRVIIIHNNSIICKHTIRVKNTTLLISDHPHQIFQITTVRPQNKLYFVDNEQMCS